MSLDCSSDTWPSGIKPFCLYYFSSTVVTYSDWIGWFLHVKPYIFYSMEKKKKMNKWREKLNRWDVSMESKMVEFFLCLPWIIDSVQNSEVTE